MAQTPKKRIKLRASIIAAISATLGTVIFLASMLLTVDGLISSLSSPKPVNLLMLIVTSLGAILGMLLIGFGVLANTAGQVREVVMRQHNLLELQTKLMEEQTRALQFLATSQNRPHT